MRPSAILEGNRLALARLLTQIENNTREGREALNELFAHTGKAHLIGITGAPGTGKSTLVNYLARYYRKPTEGPPRKVAIVAVDPSSPFTGGAILGDRIRMRDLSGDPGVFIRSMATRGSLGGLANATSGVVQVLDAAGYQVIIIETVGAGQAEVDIARLAHTTVVVEAPGLGDDIQAIKAGILEIADILVVNKADRPGAEGTERALRGMLQMAHPVTHSFQNQSIRGDDRQASIPGPAVEYENNIWTPRIQKTIATEDQGIVELVSMIIEHYEYLQKSGELVQRDHERLRTELDDLLRETLLARWRDRVSIREYDRVLERLVQRELAPWNAVRLLLDGGDQA